MPHASTPPHELTVSRQRYPEALMCTRCARLLATRAESYAASGLTEAARLAYLCAECRQEAAEAARLAITRARNLARNRAHGKAPEGFSITSAASREIPRTSTPPARRPAYGYGGNGVLSQKPLKPLIRRGRFFITARRGGRPRKTAEELGAKNLARVRAYRDKAIPTPTVGASES
jgi:hypothetical protein